MLNNLSLLKRILKSIINLMVSSTTMVLETFVKKQRPPFCAVEAIIRIHSLRSSDLRICGILETMEFWAIIILTIVIELVTIFFRLTMRLRSKILQGKLRLPRVHHGYIGMVFLLASFVFPTLSALWVIGWALVISDLLHHYTVMPLLSITEVDLNMQHYGINRVGLQRKFLITLSAVLVATILALAATSIWIGAIAVIMIAVSERLHHLLPRLKLSPEVIKHFST